jgi:hypothetical protein
MIIQTESAFFSQEGSAFVVILEWFVPYLWAFETKLTAWRTVYGKPQVGPFKYQCTLYGKPHGRDKESSVFTVPHHAEPRWLLHSVAVNTSRQHCHDDEAIVLSIT